MKNLMTSNITTVFGKNKLPDTVGDKSDTLTTDVKTILEAIIGILGLVCVVVIIMGGIQYMTSSGDSAKTQKAKNTILYAVIGLIVCVLSFAIVNFTINNILGGNADSNGDASQEETNNGGGN